VHHTHEIDLLAAVLLDLVGFLNSPRQDDVLLEAAGVSVDRALFPLLVRIGAFGSIGIVELAEQAGRDHSTISRQVAKLESLGLVIRRPARHDRRIRQARITMKGRAMVRAIAKARRRLLGTLLKDWSAEERRDLARLNQKLAKALKTAQR
jgi:DNA-binding MarR family transcriptional regulator